MKFYVLGESIKLKKVKNLKNSDDKSLYGCYNSNEKNIEYDPEQTREELTDTLLHETIHAFCDIIGLHLDEYREEILCTNLPRVLMQNFEISCRKVK